MAFGKRLSRLFQNRWLSVSLIACMVIGLMLHSYISQPKLISFLDHKIYDVMLERYGPKGVSPLPVIVDLDDASLAEYGQWPWPRFLLALLLEQIMRQGAAAVGLDVLLVEEDRSSPQKMQEDLQRHLNLDVTMSGLPEVLYNYDQLLAEVIKNLPVVLGMYCEFRPDAAPTPYKPRAIGTIVQKLPNAAPFESLPLMAAELTLPLRVFADSPTGMLNMNPDDDGVVRRIPLVAQYKDLVHTSLSLRTLMAATGQKNLVQCIGPDGLEAVRLGKYTIPVSSDGGFTVPYKGGSHTYPYYSAKDVMQGSLPPEALKGHVVFIGTSAPGLMDIRITPTARVYPGVEVHATVLDAIVQQDFLFVPPWTPGAQVLSIVVCGLIAALAFGFASSRVYAAVGIAMAVAVLYTAGHFFVQGVVFSPLYILMTIALMGALLVSMRFWLEEQQKGVLRSAFSRYVAPEVVERISKLQGDVFAGEEVELTIMFTDIRGFTSISEKLRPEQVVNLLNRYFTPMTALVRSHRGTLDKFIGDALMAFWNAPVPVPDHPVLALETALDMQATLREINPGLMEDFGITLAMGVGLHTGAAYVGNMGSEELLNYTLIGDNVNLSSRLEGLCSQYGVGLVASAETVSRCEGRFGFQQLDVLRVKGKQQPVVVFTAMPLAEHEARKEELQAHDAAIASYLGGEFALAEAAFAELNALYPAKLYAMYASRCAQLIANPPEAWDGVWTMTSK